SGSARSSRFGSRTSSQPKSGAATGAVAGNGDSDIRITAVEESNQLLIMATPAEWDSMQAAIRKLDIAPLQVHIETKILEVTLSGDLKFGVKWWFAGLKGEGYDGASYTNPNDPNGYPIPNRLDRQRSLLGAATSPAAAGNFFYSYLNSKFQVALSALQSSGQAKILSAPSLMVMNNQEAEINVGTRIPVLTQSIIGIGTLQTNNAGTTTNQGIGQTTYLDTGVILQVKPRVNPGGLVYMDVSQEVSKPGVVSANGNREINKRTLDTSIAVQSGQTILLGGLISEDDQDSDDGVPGLSRVPVLGKLFGSTSRSHQRTELIVLITPEVVSNSDEAREITEEYKRQFQNLNPLRGEQQSTPLKH
ncbi:MAG: type II secretion system protein GspD, partial [Dokdonella sp.]